MAISQTMSLNDGMSNVLKTIYQFIQPVLQAMSNMQDMMETNVDPSFVDGATSSMIDAQAEAQALAAQVDTVYGHLNQLEGGASGVPPNIQRATQETQQLAQETQNAKRKWSLMEKIVGGLAIGRLIGAARGFFQQNKATADKYILVNSQIAMMNDGLRTNQELQRMIAQSAERVNGEFTMMASNIFKLNATVGDMFSNNASVVQFVESVKQATTLSGSDLHGLDMALKAIDRSMAQGAMTAQDFDMMKRYSVRSVQAIADYMGVSIGEARGLAQQGRITADVIASSMLGAVDDINAEFGTIPKRWEDIQTQMRNASLRAFSGLSNVFSEFINSEAFKRALRAWMAGLQILARVMTVVFRIATTIFTGIMDVVSRMARFIINNIDWMIAGFGALVVALGIVKWAAIQTAIVKMAAAVKSAIAWMIKLWPITLIIGAILLLLYILDLFGISVADVLGFVAGLFGGLFAFLWNSIASTWNFIATFVEFFANVFRDPVGAIQMLFYNLWSNILNWIAMVVDATGRVGNAIADGILLGVNAAITGINWLIRALNRIPGINLNEMNSVATRAETGGSAGDAIRGMLTRPEVSDDYWHAPRMEMMNIADTASAWNDGVSGFVGGLGDRLSNLVNQQSGDYGLGTDIGLDQGFLDSMQGIEDTLGRGNNIGNIGSILDDVNLGDEDKKLFRDLAERDFILNYQAVSPNLSISVVNNNNEMTADELADEIADILSDAVDSALD